MAEYNGELLDKKPEVGVAPTAEDQDFATSKDRLRKAYEDKKKADQTSTVFGQDIPSFFTSPVGLILEGATTALLAQKAINSDTGQQLVGGIKSRLMGGGQTPTPSSSVATTMPTVNTAAIQATPAQAAPNQMEMLKQRFPDIAAQQGQQVPFPSNAAPQAVAPANQSIAPTLPGSVANQPAGIPQVNPQFTGQPAGNIPPAPPMQGPAPSVETAVATGGNVDQAIKQTVAKELDQSMKPTYNKTKANPIGPSAYNWLAGQEGPKAPEVWQNIVGDKNVSYNEFMEKNKPVYEAYIGSYGEPDPFKQAAKPGSYKKPSMIPQSIKGSVAPGTLAATAALATVPALAASGYQSYKGNKEAVEAELKDAWHSLKSAFTWPKDVVQAASKGDFQPLVDIAASFNPATFLINEVGKHDQIAIDKMIKSEKQALKVGSGRGIAPPSAYQR